MDLKKKKTKVKNRQTKLTKEPSSTNRTKAAPTTISNNALQQFMLNLFEATLLFDVCTDLQYIYLIAPSLMLVFNFHS